MSSPREVAETHVLDGNPQAALEALTRASPLLAADDLYLGARVSLLCGALEESLTWLDAAKAAFAESGDLLSAQRTELGRINALHELARNGEAVRVAEALRSTLLEIEPHTLSAADQELHAWMCAASAENLGAMLGVVGRHAAAAPVLAQSRVLYTNIGSRLDQARVGANLGLELLNTGFPHQAAAALAEARSQFLDHDDQWLLYRCIIYESQAVASTGRYGAALTLIEQADQLIIDSENATSPDALRSRLARAQVQVALNLFPEVLEQCDELTSVFRDRHMIQDLARCHLLQAMAALGLGHVAAARAAGAESVLLFHEADLPVRAAHAQITFARGLEPDDGCAQIDEAIAVLTEASEARRVSEAALTGADLATSAERRAAYVEVAEGNGALDAPELAWRTLWHRSELTTCAARRRSLLDEALVVLGSIRSDLATDYLRAPFMVNRRRPLESRLALHLDEEEVAKAFALSSAYRSSTLNIEADDDPSRSRLQQTTLLYQSVGNRLICFVATPSTEGLMVPPEVVDLGPVLDEVTDLMLDLEAEWRHLADPRLRVHLEGLRPVVERVLQRLYLAVFAKVEDRIDAGSVTVVPTGRLAALPFSALHDGTSYVHERMPISVSPGVPRVLPHEATTRSGVVVVGVGDQRAPQIEVEATQIQEITHGDLLVGATATAEATRVAAEKCRVLHLAGHSNFRTENPWLSSFRFADREVTAAELAQWNLRGATVVLASCSSGRQSNLGEDEMLGLPRALLLAGATEVVVHLWDVDDVAAVGTMSHLHQKLHTHTTAQALYSAQTATRDLHPHPYFWAAAVHYLNPHLRTGAAPTG